MDTGRFEQRRGHSAKKMGILGAWRRNSGVCFSLAEWTRWGFGIPFCALCSEEQRREFLDGSLESLSASSTSGVGGWKDPGNGGDLAGVKGWWGDNPASSGKADTS